MIRFTPNSSAASLAPASTEAQKGFPAPGPLVLSIIVFACEPAKRLPEKNNIEVVIKEIKNFIFPPKIFF
jgi:hypothetical protein